MATHTFVSTGDSIITRHVSHRRDKRFIEMVDLIRSADSAFTNLEIVTPKEPWIPFSEHGGANLGSPPFILDELKWMGFNLYSTANNHSVDYTFLGLVDTMEALKERDLVYAGSGMTLGEARKPAYFDSPTGRIALIACASTFGRSAQAAASRSDMGGRPGLNPMRYLTEYVLDNKGIRSIQDIDKALGTDVITRKMREWMPDNETDAYRFLGNDFVEGDTPRVRTTPKQNDLEEIAKSISEARRQADLVVVTIHAHEGQNGDLNTQETADFIEPMARYWIDAGADIFVGHGPHTLRPMEIYKGKPIFYSLGNFFFTSATNPRFASEHYEQYNLPATATPADLRDARSKRKDGTYTGMNRDPQFWRTVIPVSKFEDGNLIDLELYPVELGFDLPQHQRGIPVLADVEIGTEILKEFEELSSVYDTSIVTHKKNGRIVGKVKLN